MTDPTAQSFTPFSSVAAVLNEDNVDTDMLYPGRFLTRLQKKGMGECLLYDRRFDKNDAQRADFILNQPAFRNAKILISGNNFGCGSSRETAVWALRDYGFRCVIALSFGEIFYNNCLSNMLLPISVSQSQHKQIVDVARQSLPLSINLEDQLIQLAENSAIQFNIAANHRESLLTGLDEIDMRLKNEADEIALFEERQKIEQPWLW